ncbi:MAG: twin-arginine translocase subunit TatC, partial [Candidatus Hadarchaeum sp.]
MRRQKKIEARRDPRQMTWMEHLEELRSRFKVCLISIGVATLIMLAFPYQITDPIKLLSGEYQPMVSVILNSMLKIVKPERMEIIGGTITAPLEIYFIASLIFGLIASSPIVGYEI